MIENLVFKELPLNMLDDFKSSADLMLNADFIYDFEDETDYNKYACHFSSWQLIIFLADQENCLT